MSDDAGEKTEEPTQHRIDESRKKGEVASSKELNSVLILTGVLMTLILCSLFIYEELGKYIEWVYMLDAKEFFEGREFKKLFLKTLTITGKVLGPVFFTAMCLGVLSQVMQVGLIFSPEVLQLKFNRVDPIAGFKRLFSMKSIVEAIKGSFKFAVVLSIAYSVIKDNFMAFTGFLHSELSQSMSYGQQIVVQLSLSMLLGLFVVALADFAWQKYSHKQKLRMSKQEIKEESKQQDGNPEIKQRIKTIQREMSRKRMLEDVKTADVIITNPTHLSIAIKYDLQTMVAPSVVGKGADNIAMKMREIAKEYDIPIVENVPVARALYKTVKVGSGVPRTLYKTVAEILAFVYKLRKKQKALS
jgi:flagellar biosynthesis protein FlhB